MKAADPPSDFKAVNVGSETAKLRFNPENLMQQSYRFLRDGFPRFFCKIPHIDFTLREISEI